MLLLIPMVVVEVGSQMTMSASAPGRISPSADARQTVGRRRAAGFHPSLERDFTVDHTLVHQLHSMLNTTDSIRNRCEIPDAQLFLVLHAKRTVIG